MHSRRVLEGMRSHIFFLHHKITDTVCQMTAYLPKNVLSDFHDFSRQNETAGRRQGTTAPPFSRICKNNHRDGR